MVSGSKSEGRPCRVILCLRKEVSSHLTKKVGLAAIAFIQDEESSGVVKIILNVSFESSPFFSIGEIAELPRIDKEFLAAKFFRKICWRSSTEAKES